MTISQSWFLISTFLALACWPFYSILSLRDDWLFHSLFYLNFRQNCRNKCVTMLQQHSLWKCAIQSKETHKTILKLFFCSKLEKCSIKMLTLELVPPPSTSQLLMYVTVCFAPTRYHDRHCPYQQMAHLNVLRSLNPWQLIQRNARGAAGPTWVRRTF